MPGLDQYFNNGSIIGQQLGLQAFNQAQDNQALQGADTLQKLFQTEQMNPLKLQEQQAINDQYAATLPGHRAQSRTLEQTADIGAATMPGKIASTNSRYAQEQDDDVNKHLENLAQRLLWSKNPEEQALGRQMIADSKDVYGSKLKTGYQADRDERKIRLTGQEQRLTEAQAAANGKYNRAGSKTPIDVSNPQATLESIKQGLATGKLTYEKASTMVGGLAMALEMQAAMSDDPAEQQQLTQTADYFKQMGNAFAQKVIEKGGAPGAAPRAGTPSVGGLGLPENAPRPATPFPSVGGASAPGGAASAPAKVFSLQELQTAYPDKTEQQLREQAKKIGAIIK